MAALTNRQLEKAAIAVISSGFIVWSAVFIYRSSFVAIDGKRYFCLFDDAMISMRYAWNFSHGLGLVWNVGERVQGYTNLLMTLLMSLATLIFNKSHAALIIQIAGAGFMLAIAYLTMRIADHISDGDSEQRQLVRVLSFFCALAYYPLAYWSLMGMETGLLTVLLLLTVLSALNYTQNGRPALLLLVAGCSGLAYLTRNDSAILVLPVGMYIIWQELSRSTPRESFLRIAKATGVYLVFVFGQLLFQKVYYGEFLPNTYTLKLTGMPLLARLRDGIGFVTPFLAVTSFILVVSGLDLVLYFEKRKCLLVSITLASVAYQIYVGGDPWSYWRMMASSMPLVSILFINAIVSVATATCSRFRRNPIFTARYTTIGLILSLTLVGLLTANLSFLPEISLIRRPYQTPDNQYRVNAAILVDRLTTSDATVGVIWGGSIPYFTGRRAVDFLGKCDRYVAHLHADVSGSVSWCGMRSVPGHNKYDLSYSIKALAPTYVEGFQWGAQDLSQWAHTRYVRVEYDGIGVFLLSGSPAVLWSRVSVPELGPVAGVAALAQGQYTAVSGKSPVAGHSVAGTGPK